MKRSIMSYTETRERLYICSQKEKRECINHTSALTVQPLEYSTRFSFSTDNILESGTYVCMYINWQCIINYKINWKVLPTLIYDLSEISITDDE